ncbi:hypothetical protein LCGC14_2002220 [marine sediment metagenome]|uniref:Uncharacterized protein n=1 Tax=marine sediment metagenome TaxID=412755 RepID=A0A0F9HG73_9ZZZZ
MTTEQREVRAGVSLFSCVVVWGAVALGLAFSGVVAPWLAFLLGFLAAPVWLIIFVYLWWEVEE